MPTPSSHGDNDSLAFNSTCPEEQVAAQTGWLHPPPSYEVNDPAHTESAPDSSTDTGVSEDHTSTSNDGVTSSRSSSTMSPGIQPPSDSPTAPATDESMFLNEGEQDDDANKQTDTDEDMGDRTPAGGAHDARDDTSRSVDRRASSLARFYIPDSEVWEPYGVNQGLQRRLDVGAPRALDPVGVEGAKAEDLAAADGIVWEDDPGYMGCDPTSLRVIPASPSTYLRPGSRFVGTQQSERQVYDVQVEIKHVDLRESFLCGYLRIQGLTEDHPTLTTYFEGEIIGSKYGFTTKHKSWGANDRIDMSHWAKFVAFRQFSRQAKKGNFLIKEYLQKENIFMRWKEQFLVPDHRVQTINGASYEGFYYICFNQVEGVVHGIYFHSKSEKFQQLELKHVEDKGCMSALEFR